MRTFISIDIPEEVKKEIQRVQKNLPEFYGRKTELENLHLTLKFLGGSGASPGLHRRSGAGTENDEQKVEEVKNKLREIQSKKFEAEIDSIGVFSEKFIRIVWLHLSNCEKLQKEVDEKLKNLFEPGKRFMSHLTIARVKKCDKKKFLEELKKIEIPKIRFRVDNFKLKKSILTEQGPVYETLEKYNLD